MNIFILVLNTLIKNSNIWQNYYFSGDKTAAVQRIDSGSGQMEHFFIIFSWITAMIIAYEAR